MNTAICRFLMSVLVLLCLASHPAGSADQKALRAVHQVLLRAVRQQVLQTPYIVINTQDNQLLLRSQYEVLHRAACATGSGRKLEGPKLWKHNWVFDTPKGRFAVLRKVEDPLWIKPEWAFIEAGEDIPVFAEDLRRFQYGVLGKYALYFARDYMIHGTLYEINLGKSITHGCVRVGDADLQYLYDRVQPGCPVYIY